MHDALAGALSQTGLVEASYRVRAPGSGVRTLLTRRIGLPDVDGRVDTVVGLPIDVTPAAATQ